MNTIATKRLLSFINIWEFIFNSLKGRNIGNVNIGNTSPTPIFSINDKMKAPTLGFHFFNILVIKVI